MDLLKTDGTKYMNDLQSLLSYQGHMMALHSLVMKIWYLPHSYVFKEN
jgi:hypothetical protein